MQALPSARLVTNIVTALLIIFFLHSVIDNFVRIESLQNVLAFYTHQFTVAAWAVVVFEAAVAILLFFPRTRIAGLVLSLVFIIVFAVVVRSFPDHPHLFGGFTSYVWDKYHLLFELVFGIPVIAVLLLTTLPWKKGREKIIIVQ